MINTAYMGELGKEKQITFPYKAEKVSYENLIGRNLGGFLPSFFHALHPENQNLPLCFNLYIRNYNNWKQSIFY